MASATRDILLQTERIEQGAACDECHVGLTYDSAERPR
jgi:hypothetical protein